MSDACPSHHRCPDRRQCLSGGLLCLHLFHSVSRWFRFNKHHLPRVGGCSLAEAAPLVHLLEELGFASVVSCCGSGAAFLTTDL
ncbi:hypothetical protein A2U01_0038135, partial [Trifolium medium]|nr:hypothetical protein [Trifolium medium]